MTDLQRRVRQTILLLQTLTDVYPTPATWTGNLVQRSTLPGPSPSRWQRCETCDGQGRTLDRYKHEHQCDQCNGHGRYKVDDYTQQRVGTLEHGLVTHTTTVRCDRCNGEGVWKFQRCQLCDGSGRRATTPREQANGHEITRRRDDLNLWGKTGSYHELDRELQHVKQLDPHAHRLVWNVYVIRSSDDTSHPILRATVTFITYRMPNPILIPAGISAAEKRAREHVLRLKGRSVDPRARQARDQEIRKLIRQGKPVQWVAQQTGLSIRTIYDVVRGQVAA